VLRAHPDDLEWVRLSGFAHVLGAKAAASAENHEDAIREIEKAIGIRERLIAEDRKYPRHKYDLADAHNLHGKCLRELQRVDDAIAAHVLAHELYADLAVGEPDVLDYSIELSRTELHLTTCYLSRRTRADDRRAEQWLNEAEGRLTALREADRLGSRDWDVKALFEAIDTDRRILARRASRTSEGS
jgi:tetratricopeptide (TPR) repeat protein